MKIYWFGVCVLSISAVLAYAGVCAEDVDAPRVIAVDDGDPPVALSDEDRSKLEGSQEAHQYQAEVARLMDIIINSLYTQREVFLRELISNSVDALEKVRFLSISNKDVLAGKTNLDIRVEYDEASKILSITDSGIGMTKNDLINNLGTVAKSGTSNFLEALAQGNDVSLIGQFGVGFYSAFLVADRVTVVSKSNDDDQYIWESTADARYYVVKDPRGNTLGRGTSVSLHLKEDATDFLNEHKLKELISRYSQFMSYPIYLKIVKTVTEEIPDEHGSEAEGEEKKKGDVEVEDDGNQKDEKKAQKIEKKVREWERVNTQKAIWLRSKDDVTDEEYKEFYKAIAKDWSDPLVHMHFSAEGEIEFKALLFIPKRAPMDIYNNYFGKQTSIKLYVRRVLVADSFDDLLPKYLHFIRGVVDSDDLPLNVSREQLQQQKILGVISKKLVRKTLETIRKMHLESMKEKAELMEQFDKETDEEKKTEQRKKLEAPSDFDNLYKEYSRNLMLGCYEDDANRSKIARVLQFPTSKSPNVPKPLEVYVKNMPESQGSIYYAAGESKEQLMKLPQMQIFRKKDIEVVFLLESMDEACIGKVIEFEGKKFESIQKGEVTLEETDEEKKRNKKLKKYFEPLMKWWKEKLGGKVTRVDISRRLVDDPCAVVASQWGYSAQMEKIMKTQTFSDPMHLKMMTGQKIFEINPNHKVIQYLLEKVNAGGDVDAHDSALAEQLFDTAMLASGFDVERPSNLAQLLYKTIAMGAGVNPEAVIDDNLSLPEGSEEPDDSNLVKDDTDGNGIEDVLKGIDLTTTADKDEL